MTPGIRFRLRGASPLPALAAFPAGTRGVVWRPADPPDGPAPCLLETGDLVALTWAQFHASAAVADFHEAAAEALAYLDLVELTPAERLNRYALVFTTPWPALIIS